ncbi:Sjogren's syndrome/scleroderma autoantigen 1 family protein [Haloferax sp. YSMS24]|uniref:Sjogren's syndrome/scleroderma autoantigen 1 family protein n=1 Tax=Haloferax sp. YSMS24 TaxID=3388425 RepID=UPI00398CE0D8
MSEFDKEAERQRLREKYERDESKRRSTQRMSELLLKGATMTNKHCDQCGDPIFRYDGQEFCPTCQTQGQAAASADADADSAAEAVAEAEATPDAGEATTASQQADDAGQATAGATAQETDGQSNIAAGAAQNATADPGHPRDASPTADPRPTETSATTRRTSSARQTQSDEVASARESLVRTLTWAANQAESTDDPRRAREFLAAAREAAEALAALDR